MSETTRERQFATVPAELASRVAAGLKLGGVDEWQAHAARDGKGGVEFEVHPTDRRAHCVLSRVVEEVQQSVAPEIYSAGDVPELRSRLAELTALREADQATIATLGLVNKSLADALEGLRFHRIITGMSAHIRDFAEHRGEPNPLDAADAALRSAGRLPAQKGESDV